ncbi:MAG: hypothetical protein PHD54_00670 [Desulfuromonadaceae bacterium]|nr:hypothetical protein [Desulfuromonadaceae bacterium]
MKNWKMNVCFWLVGNLLLTVLAGCATRPLNDSLFPPILSQDEVVRSYEKLGRIEITREVYLSDGLISNDIREWGFSAIRKEAAKMGADAVIFPEITGAHTMTIMLPSTEYRATGIAIKFK